MIRTSGLQTVAFLAVGGLLGYAAATTRLDGLRKASAEPPRQTLTDKAEGPACCSGGASRGQLVALADPKADDGDKQG